MPPPDAAELIAEGNRAEQAGHLAEACALYRRAIEAEPTRAAAHLNLGAALEASGDFAGAERAYRAVLEFDPGNAFANYNLAIGVLALGGEPRAAAELLGRALERKPDFADAHVALASALEAMGANAQAAVHLRSALDLRPDYTGAWYNYGLILLTLERLDEAEDALRRALELEPGYLAALEALGALMRRLGRVEDSLQAYAAARRLAPQELGPESGELFTLLFSPAPSARELAERHRAFGERLEAAHLAQRHGPGEPERRLRIGYVSADLYRHPVALFLIPALERRDRGGFDVRCYMTGTASDAVTAQLRGLADGWRDVAALDDDTLAAVIRNDGIDVLVDLTGHSGPLRLGVFAKRPAPVQVSWLGYLHTLGMRRVGFRLCDAFTDPPGESDALHSEALVRLPGSQWCYRPFLEIERASVPPSARNGFVTFGSFNHASKISTGNRRAWSELLREVPNSRLVVVGVPPGRTTDALVSDLCAGGVEDWRITVVPRASLDGYFRWYNEVDIALDTSPYSGGTTTCDALWMGVPVVTAPGARSVSRSAASLLTAAGLADWIAGAPEGYTRLAIDKARDASGLAELRVALPRRMQASVLMDETGFARNLEAAFRRMWREWCENPSRFEG